MSLIMVRFITVLGIKMASERVKVVSIGKMVASMLDIGNLIKLMVKED